MLMLTLCHQPEAIKRMMASKKTDNRYEEKNFAVRSRTATPHWLSATCSLSLTAMVTTPTKGKNNTDQRQNTPILVAS
jgi:hypothetical protein